jgi:hypothetical protein
MRWTRPAARAPAAWRTCRSVMGPPGRGQARAGARDPGAPRRHAERLEVTARQRTCRSGRRTPRTARGPARARRACRSVARRRELGPIRTVAACRPRAMRAVWVARRPPILARATVSMAESADDHRGSEWDARQARLQVSAPILPPRMACRSGERRRSAPPAFRRGQARWVRRALGPASPATVPAAAVPLVRAVWRRSVDRRRQAARHRRSRVRAGATAKGVAAPHARSGARPGAAPVRSAGCRSRAHGLAMRAVSGTGRVVSTGSPLPWMPSIQATPSGGDPRAEALCQSPAGARPGRSPASAQSCRSVADDRLMAEPATDLRRDSR